MARQGADQKAATRARINRTEAYAEKVRGMFAETVNDILALNRTMPNLEEGEMFSFDDASQKKQKEVEALLRRLHSAVTTAVRQGIMLEWKQANEECDKLIRSTFGKKVLESPDFAAWTDRNDAARDAFVNRTEGGLNLSARVWKSVRQLREEMEVAMTVSIGEGESASTMSRKVRSYLNDPDLMFRRFRYKDEAGEWQRKWKKRVKDEATGKYKWIDYDKDSYRTGAGVYKSSAKNAMRVTRTETNIAYRRADNERWSQMDFVLGQRVQLSKNHPKKDICDKLQGDYPKEFVFDGWHPQCFCYVTPITIPPEETVHLTEMMLRGEDWRGEMKRLAKGREIKDYPDNFKNWVAEHADDIAAARERGTEPYFIRNNAKVIDDILNPEAAAATTTTASGKIADNLQAVAKAVGVEVGKPMTFEEADHMHPNPHYKEAVRYRVNCQSAVVAYELRRRGLPVEAFGRTKSGMGEMLTLETRAAWVDTDGKMPTRIACKYAIKERIIDNERGYVRNKYTTSDKVLNDFLSRTSEVGRYHVLWRWNDGENKGHIITMETFADGSRLFYDPQTGQMAKDITLWAGKKMSNIDLWTMGICAYRVDNLQPNPVVVKGVVKKAGSTAATPSMTVEQKTWWETNVTKKADGGVNGSTNKLHEWHKEIRKSSSFPISEERTMINLQTGRIWNKGEARRHLIDHIWSKDELKAAQYAWEHPEQLKYVRNSPLGEGKNPENPKEAANIEKKRKRGVTSYNQYEIAFNRKVWTIKMEVMNGKREQFYHIKRKG